MGKVKELIVGVTQDDYDYLAWENENFAKYLKKVLGYGKWKISQIATGNIKINKESK